MIGNKVYFEKIANEVCKKNLEEVVRKMSKLQADVNDLSKQTHNLTNVHEGLVETISNLVKHVEPVSCCL